MNKRTRTHTVHSLEMGALSAHLFTFPDSAHMAILTIGEQFRIYDTASAPDTSDQRVKVFVFGCLFHNFIAPMSEVQLNFSLLQFTSSTDLD